MDVGVAVHRREHGVGVEHERAPVALRLAVRVAAEVDHGLHRAALGGVDQDVAGDDRGLVVGRDADAVPAGLGIDEFEQRLVAAHDPVGIDALVGAAALVVRPLEPLLVTEVIPDHVAAAGLDVDVVNREELLVAVVVDEVAPQRQVLADALDLASRLFKALGEDAELRLGEFAVLDEHVVAWVDVDRGRELRIALLRSGGVGELRGWPGVLDLEAGDGDPPRVPAPGRPGEARSE